MNIYNKQREIKRPNSFRRRRQGHVNEQEVDGMVIKTGLQLAARELEMCQWPDINPTAHGSMWSSVGSSWLHVGYCREVTRNKNEKQTLVK